MNAEERRGWVSGVLILAVAAVLHAEPATGLRLPAGARGATFDPKSFLVGGRRVLLRCGGVPYFRLPPEDWADRLRQTRLAGFNAVETPVPWNLHEPARGTFRFEGVADLGRFLDLCREEHLLVLLRIGPFVNAMVTSGGLPAWLGDDPKCRIRSSEGAFLDAVRAWWQKLFAVVVPRQAPNGPVVLVQIEDRYKGQDAGYLARLFGEAESLGIAVPVVLSELVPCRDFGGLREPESGFVATTELLPVDVAQWGDGRGTFEGLDDLLFEGLAKGVKGYNHPLWTAGTNFALLPASAFPTRFETASSGLLEGGGLSEAYAPCKRANCFARAFAPVLAQAAAAPSHPLLEQARQAGLVAYARSDGTTTLLFFKRRWGTGPLTLRDAATGLAASVPVSATTYRHVVVNFPLTEKTALAFASAQVLVAQRLGSRWLLAVYAPVGSEVVLAFGAAERPAVRAGQDGLTWDDARKQLVLRWSCKEKKARADFAFTADVPVHVVAMDEELAADAWVLEGAGFLVGAPGVGGWTRGAGPEVELRLPARRTRLTLSFYPAGEERSVAKFPGLLSASYDEAAGRIDFRVDWDATRPVPVSVRKWEAAPDLVETAAGFDDASWASDAHPKPLGDVPYGWYRCAFTAPRAGPERLQFRNVADAVTVWLNGSYVGQSATKRLVDAQRNFAHPASFELPLSEGRNVLVVLAKNWGQYRNAASFDVPLASTTGWGLLDDAWVGSRPLLRWRQRDGLAPSGRPLAWAPLDKVPDTPPRWYRASFALRAHPARAVPRIVLKGLGYGALWVNGHFAGLYQQRGHETGHGYFVPGGWLRDQNEVIVFEEEPRKRPEFVELEYDPRGTVVPVKVRFGP